MENKSIISFRKLVMQEDLNASNTLFGGKMMAFIDEAASLYVMCQLKTPNIVTLKVSELLFKVPVLLGDFLEFEASTIHFGKTSISVKINVYKKELESDSQTLVTECSLVFVAVDSKTRKPCTHILAPKDNV